MKGTVLYGPHDIRFEERDAQARPHCIRSDRVRGEMSAVRQTTDAG